jgi:photosystem II stability/assembly factor-like uncharacterized protein
MRRLSRVVSIAVGILVALGAAQGEAGLNVWTSGGPPGGGGAETVAFDPVTPTTIYAGGLPSNRGAFKSLNGGASWTPINNGLNIPNFPLLSVTSMVVDHQNPNVVYAGTFLAGVFKSVNGGASWVQSNGVANQPGQIPQAVGIGPMAMDPQNPSIVYVGSTNGLFKTTDGGATWSRIETGLTNKFVFSIAIDRQVPSTLYVSVQTDRVFKSDNGGGNWAPMNNGLPSQGGVNFGVNALAVDPQNRNIVYAGLSPGGVAKSTNGGASWVQTSQAVLSTVVNAVTIDPVNPSTVYAGTNGSGVFRTTDGGATWQTFREGMNFVGIHQIAISASGTCLHAATFTAGVMDLETQPGGCAPALVASVLPASRSVQVGVPATAFATIINPSNVTAVGCVIGLATGINAAFTFQTTDPTTNAVTGTPNTPVNIGPGGFQTFVISITPNVAFLPTDVQFFFGCQNTGGASPIVGVNTLLLSASNTPVPDMVALAATDPANLGYVVIPGANGIGAFAVATVNVGQAGGAITVVADTGGVPLPIVLTVCQTNPGTGQCLAAPSPSVTTTVNPNETPTYAIFAAGLGIVPDDPALHRVFVRALEGAITRGATSVAVRSQ